MQPHTHSVVHAVPRRFPGMFKLRMEKLVGRVNNGEGSSNEGQEATMTDWHALQPNR